MRRWVACYLGCGSCSWTQAPNSWTQNSPAMAPAPPRALIAAAVRRAGPDPPLSQSATAGLHRAAPPRPALVELLPCYTDRPPPPPLPGTLSPMM
jgi:hypothetical protein